MEQLELPKFRLFMDPVREKAIVESAQACCLCGKTRGWLYDGPTYGSSLPDGSRVCPWCISDGTAAQQGLAFNDATMQPLLDQTPQLADEERRLVEDRTPGFTTWQGNHWMMCCGIACVYLGEARNGDLTDRWRGAVDAIFRDQSAWGANEVADLVRQVGGGHICAYVFQCRACERLTGFWDCD
jgi:uncharacterized protein CbrC (UPF0167 family)